MAKGIEKPDSKKIDEILSQYDPLRINDLKRMLGIDSLLNELKPKEPQHFEYKSCRNCYYNIGAEHTMSLFINGSAICNFDKYHTKNVPRHFSCPNFKHRDFSKMEDNIDSLDTTLISILKKVEEEYQ